MVPLFEAFQGSGASKGPRGGKASKLDAGRNAYDLLFKSNAHSKGFI